MLPILLTVAAVALAAALAAFFPGLDEFARVPVENSRGEEVGEVVAV